MDVVRKLLSSGGRVWSGMSLLARGTAVAAATCATAHVASTVWRRWRAPPLGRGIIVLVTGASAGIGRALALKLAALGCTVIGVARSEDKLQQLLGAADGLPGRMLTMPCDVSDPAAVERLRVRVLQDVGAPRILVNNAGSGEFRYLWEQDAHDIPAMLNAPTVAAALMCRALVPAMCAHEDVPAPVTGVVVNVQSPMGFAPMPGATMYCTARGALHSLTSALRADLAAGTSLRVQEVILPHVKSAYWAHNPGSEERLPGIRHLLPVISAESAADVVIEAIRDGRETYAYPAMLSLLLASTAVAPWLTAWLTTATSSLRIDSQRLADEGWEGVSPPVHTKPE